MRSKDKDPIRCNWLSLRSYLTDHWKNISAKELDQAGPSRKKIVFLFGKKYGFGSQMAENYLRNIERTLPLAG